MLGAMSARPSERPPRIRRTAEESRTAILDATERRLVAAGPSGIRLQDVADDVGVSHPTILHHFGSRERLVEEVVQRRIEAMNADVLGALAAGGVPDDRTVRALFERLSESFGPGGHARVVAFLALDGQRGPAIDGLMPLVHALQANRVALAKPGAPPPTLEDSTFTVLLVALALFGDAIVGPMFRGETDPEEAAASSARFRAWLASFVQRHLERER